MMYNIRSGAIRWLLPNLVHDGNINGCSISHRFAMYSQKQGHNWLKMNVMVRVEERYLRHSTEMSEFMQVIFSEF